MDFIKKLFIRKQTHTYAFELLNVAKKKCRWTLLKVTAHKTNKNYFQKRSVRNRPNKEFN